MKADAPPQAYTDLEARHRRMSALGQAMALLHWDRATMMKDGSAPARAEQMAALSVLMHEMATDPELGDILALAEDSAPALGEWQRANLREMRRTYDQATAMPPALVEAASRAASECEMAWRGARLEDDYAALAPKLKEVVRLTREEAGIKAARFGCSPYEALLREYDPGRSVAQVDALFDELLSFLPSFLDDVVERQAGERAPAVPQGPFPIAAQETLGRTVMARLGFDFDKGRLDVSHHPFSGGTPDDSRITTRYDEADFTSSLMGVIHETGHALYEAGLPPEWRGQPVGRSRGMTLHESQSLLFEMQTGRSAEFVSFLAPLARETFGGSGVAWEAGNLHRLYTRVERSLIRVDADEVTYPLHVILRYRLERAMLAGDLEVEDLPGAWREGMLEMLGVAPETDREGCMQDIHWPSGSFGYFPTYTLGALAAAQIMAVAEEAHPGLREALARGDASPLLGFVRERIHSQGCRLEPGALIEEATGAPLRADAFRAHLERRYGG